MASEHITKAYDEELRGLNNTVAEMGGLAESQLGSAIEAVATRDTEVAGRVVEGDAKIDQAQPNVDIRPPARGTTSTALSICARCARQAPRSTARRITITE